MDSKHKYYWLKVNRVINDYSYDILLGIIPDVIGIEGVCNGDQIVMDPRGQLLPTFIHECLHLAYPSWSEERVLKTEEELVKQLSPKQWQNLLIKLANRV